MLPRPPRSTLFPYRRSSDLRVGRIEHLMQDELHVAQVRGVLSHGGLLLVRRGSRCEGQRFVFARGFGDRSEEHTSELQSHSDLVCRLLLEKKKKAMTVADLH